MINWQDLIRQAAEIEASDVFFKAGTVPYRRVKGVIEPVPDAQELSPEDTSQLAQSLMNEQDWAKFQE